VGTHGSTTTKESGLARSWVDLMALSPPSRAAFPEVTTATTHLRGVLGDTTYDSLARKGEAMTTSAMATFAYDQIDQARAELNAVSK